MRPDGYIPATRHPWAVLAFVLPFLSAYEIGLVLLNPEQPDAGRNGADSWLRWALGYFGLAGLFWLPVVLLLWLLVWSFYRRHDRPSDLGNVWLGMLAESVLAALGLLALSRGVGPCLDKLGLSWQLAGPAPSSWDPALERIVIYFGAGIYEETLFRLILFTGLIRLFDIFDLPSRLTWLLAALASALAFALAHNLGPWGEAYDARIFCFRTLAGFYLAMLYYFRGFGITVGTHAGYDVLVGVLM